MNKNNYVLSVVIPSYNMEKFLDGSLKKLTASSYLPDIEIIVVNDGSKDRTSEIAHKYKVLYPESVVVVDKENGHYGSCLNVAMSMARGTYFRILDADDWFETKDLDAFVEKLLHCEADLVVTLRVEANYDKQNILQKEYRPIKNVEYGKVYDIHQFSISEHSKDVEFNMHSMTYKTEILRETKLVFPTSICYTDMLYFMVPLIRAHTMVIYDIYLYNYLLDREGNSTNMKSLCMNLSHINKVLICMFEYLDTLNLQALTSVMKDNLYRYINEALAMFIISIRMHRHISKTDYEYIGRVLNYCKQYNIRHRLFNKYYFRQWYKKNTYASLNRSLFLYKLLHPCKKRF